MRRLQDNWSILIKVITIFITRCGRSLWSSYMLNKYYKKWHPTMAVDRGGSHTWKKMVIIRDAVEPHIFWYLRNGTSSFWYENWTRLGALYYITPDVAREEEIEHIKDNIKVPDGEEDDEPCRMLETNGKFSVKSAWEFLRHRESKQTNYGFMWEKELPIKISFFMWRVWKGIITTDDILKRMMINIPSRCLTLTFDYVENVVVRDIQSNNSKSFHFNVFMCNNVRFSHVNIKAPDDSPNTDRIHIGFSTNIQVLDSNIGTGDDCISMIAGSKSINISGVTCGLGHGISIGSLGNITANDVVEYIHVKSCTRTQNGARIKTWAPSNVGSTTTITFEDIIMKKVGNPILIDQYYCPTPPCSGQVLESSVQIKDVTFNNIRGTSSSVIAVTLKCNASFPCQGIKVNQLDLSWPWWTRDLIVC
ncbi:exopolygalacturonase-like [Lycium ferocissimum]|uniref:exopolygalacturonase-like n=1 Tax=Lycium ferocissimum TaxID=112874 RepID=UPI002814BB74|nr:exopolygalacturonase-like [Lycium ferocissimum]